MVIINESGLYSLVLSSELPGAKALKRGRRFVHPQPWLVGKDIAWVHNHPHKRGHGFLRDPFFLLLHPSRSWTEWTAHRRLFLFGISQGYPHREIHSMRRLWPHSLYPAFTGSPPPPIDVWWKGLP